MLARSSLYRERRGRRKCHPPPQTGLGLRSGLTEGKPKPASSNENSGGRNEVSRQKKGPSPLSLSLSFSAFQPLLAGPQCGSLQNGPTRSSWPCHCAHFRPRRYELDSHYMVFSYEVLLGFEAKGNREDRESRSYREGPRRYSFKDA